MLNETLESLPKSKVGSEFISILKERIPLEERLTAIYVRALKPGVWDGIRFKYDPAPPKGWLEDFTRYKTVDPNYREGAWKTMREKYYGYIKELEEIKAENDSNKFFLQEILEHFKKSSLPSFAEKVKQRLLEFEPCFT